MTTAPSHRRILAASLVGTAVEFYDFYIYATAAALVFGEVNLATFTDAKVADPRVRSLIPKISMKTDERWKDDSEFATEVIVTTETGRRLARHIALAAGKPDRWFSPEQLRAKFDDCTHAFGKALQQRVFGALRGLDSAQDVLPLLELLRFEGWAPHGTA